ncbi:hypothetical protein C4D60_Mb08t21750 [Musa balbisiana]|uniref:Uncharacterized protein n=1 Tax=Musa balbisiana TaxID=52838 RepID=A0A4V4H940_MUSBA|nr:hypothetical protein C4D60_Mb08t21750 [Musa balbisiana]
MASGSGLFKFLRPRASARSRRTSLPMPPRASQPPPPPHGSSRELSFGVSIVLGAADEYYLLSGFSNSTTLPFDWLKRQLLEKPEPENGDS